MDPVLALRGEEMRHRLKVYVHRIGYWVRMHPSAPAEKLVDHWQAVLNSGPQAASATFEVAGAVILSLPRLLRAVVMIQLSRTGGFAHPSVLMPFMETPWRQLSANPNRFA